MKRMHKIIICFTLLSVLICTTVFSASATYVESVTPREGILRSIVETNSYDNSDPFYYDYGAVSFEDNEFSGQPIFVRDWDETNSSIVGYDSLVRYNTYLIEGEEDMFYYDLDSYITSDTADSSGEILQYYIHSLEFNLNDFPLGENYFAMDNFSCYVSTGNVVTGYDNIDACYFDGHLCVPFVSSNEVYTPDGDYYDIDAGLRYIRFEFIPYQADEFVQPFVEVGKTVFTDFDMGVYEYDSIPFPQACRLFFRDAYGFDDSEYGRIASWVNLVEGCYRVEFAGDISRNSSSMSLTVPYLTETINNYIVSFPLSFAVEDVQVEPFEWLLQSGQAALEFELLPNLTVGHILLVMLAIPVLIAALRLLAGG